jgi:flagellar secretion chaperone FliS
VPIQVGGDDTDTQSRPTPESNFTMFAPAAVHPNAPNAYASIYRQVGVETGVAAASPHRLVTMLFDGFNDAIAQARAAMHAGHVQAKGRAIVRAARIVDEGLKAALDVDAGGTLAHNLSALYGYVAMRLTQANLHNDAAALDECVGLMEPLRTAWLAIGPDAGSAAKAQ